LDEISPHIWRQVKFVADLNGTISGLIVEVEYLYLTADAEADSDDEATMVARDAISLLTASRSAVALAGSLLERAAQPGSIPQVDERIQPHLGDIDEIALDVFQASKRLAEIRTKLIPAAAETTVYGLGILDTSLEHLVESAKLLGILSPAAGSVSS
jgi:hypothetical protein